VGIQGFRVTLYDFKVDNDINVSRVSLHVYRVLFMSSELYDSKVNINVSTVSLHVYRVSFHVFRETSTSSR